MTDQPTVKYQLRSYGSGDWLGITVSVDEPGRPVDDASITVDRPAFGADGYEVTVGMASVLAGSVERYRTRALVLTTAVRIAELLEQWIADGVELDYIAERGPDVLEYEFRDVGLVRS